MGILMETTEAKLGSTGCRRRRMHPELFGAMGAPGEFYTDTLHTIAINTRETEFGSIVEPIPITLKAYKHFEAHGHAINGYGLAQQQTKTSVVVAPRMPEFPSTSNFKPILVKEETKDKQKIACPPPKKKWIKEYLEEEPKSPLSVRVVTGLTGLPVTTRSNGVVRPTSPVPVALPCAAVPSPVASAVTLEPVPTAAAPPPAPLLDFAQEHSRPRTTSNSHGPPQIPSPPSVSNGSGSGSSINGNSSGSGGSSGSAPRAGTREVHNKLEKNRRAHLKECFELLKRQLPATPEDKKTSNLSILASAIRYIQVLRRKERDCEHEMERLAREKIAAQQRLSALKREISVRATVRPRSIDHVCFKNYSGSSTGMEALAITEGFKSSMEMYGIIYSQLIADGDSSTYKSILDANPYRSLIVEKIECTNHLLRNYCTKLDELTKDTRHPLHLRKVLSQSILRLRRSVTGAVKHNNSKKEKTFDEKITDLKIDLLNGPNHVFGNHSTCKPYYCKHVNRDTNCEIVDKNLVPEMKTCTLYNAITKLVSRLVNNSKSLIYSVNSNIAEVFNSIVAKFVGGKRINYSSRQSYSARCATSVVAFNTKQPITYLYEKVIHKKPNTLIRRLELKRKKMRPKSKPSRKITLQKPKNNIDKDYGYFCQKPDLNKIDFEFAKNEHLNKLKLTEVERNDLERRTVLQSDSMEWVQERRQRLTASSFGKVCKRGLVKCGPLVKNLLRGANLENVKSIQHGKDHENIALEQLTVFLSSIDGSPCNIEKCGLFVDEKIPYLGASPDGLLDSVSEDKDREDTVNGQVLGIPLSISASPPRSIPRMETSPPRTLNLSTKLRTLPIQITPTTSQVVRTSYGTRPNTLTLTTLASADHSTQIVENGVTNPLSTTLVHPAQIHLPISQMVNGSGLVVGPAALQLLSTSSGLRVVQAPVHTNGVTTSAESIRIPKENGIVSPKPASTTDGSVMVSGLTPLVVSQPAAHLLQTHTLTHKMVETQVVKGSVAPLTVSAQYLSATTIVKPVVVVSAAGPSQPPT
ncbi:unnamed protein product [Arctia plantaginis]|uniref:Max-binding protein MNT n=1 Tax=Arctia plantaginis TaxID=874455 RepID=A0A8S1B2Y4_ARCPL|nr:unnamed protein product [Arctia plantaginis]